MDRHRARANVAASMNTSLTKALFGEGVAPDLGPGPRHGVASIRDIETALDEILTADHQRRELIRALALLWHDHHEASHAIVQDMETRDGSYIHAILHRREPDYFNAKYWFRRVGQHPCFDKLAVRAGEILKTETAGDAVKKLLPGGQWDSFAFVDACEAAALPSAPLHATLREIQRAEFEILLDYLGR
jgi:hypothetical protein